MSNIIFIFTYKSKHKFEFTCFITLYWKYCSSQFSKHFLSILVSINFYNCLSYFEYFRMTGNSHRILKRGFLMSVNNNSYPVSHPYKYLKGCIKNGSMTLSVEWLGHFECGWRTHSYTYHHCFYFTFPLKKAQRQKRLWLNLNLWLS